MKGSIAFGFPVVATPLLALVLDVKTAVAISLVPNIVMDGVQVCRRGGVLAGVRRLLALLVFGLLGMVLGTRLLVVLPPHVALAVPDIQEAKAELDRMGVEHWVTRGVVGPESQQIFMYDPFGNMIELHQAGTCRCITGNRQPVKGMS